MLINVWSEFGRRPEENGSGTDHGAAGRLAGHRHAGARARWSASSPASPRSTRTTTSATRPTSARVYCSLLEQWLDVDAAGIIPERVSFARPALVR